ncbi:GreA/GreB family elongation factor [Nocardioides sp.]|uniref:GreA/GreB family elongation factor n=1 Tax=Nocardioides sp. TaxID=35761 RepID=UPI002B27B008|nr:GreA/GreB family elongation factor [Nocardioides sp.]
MTATATPHTDLLASRLQDLRAERDAALAETRQEQVGDIADRATNVEASIRLGTLDERIAALELEIDAASRVEHVAGVVSLGDQVVLDLGDGPETFVVGSVEAVAAGVEAVTPTSPLGQALRGAAAGTTVSYAPRRGVTLKATIVSVG